MTAQPQEGVNMAEKYKRKKFFIHPSSQLKYIAFSVIPALVMTFYCTYSILESGELVLRTAKEKPLVPVYTIRQTIAALEKQGYTHDTADKVTRLKGDLDSLKKTLETTYVDTLTQWDKTRRNIFVVLLFVLVFVGLLSLVYSHRIAGPLYRIKRCVEMLAEGKNMSPIRLRKHDEFKELAASLDRLRATLKEKGFLA
jgi:HAMP domain-containing protein